MNIHVLPDHIGEIAFRSIVGLPTSSSERALLEEHLDGLHATSTAQPCCNDNAGASVGPIYNGIEQGFCVDDCVDTVHADPVGDLLKRAVNAVSASDALTFAQAARCASEALNG